MMPEVAIAFACRSAIAVSCGSVLTADKPFACRYREILSAMSAACTSVEVIATTAPSKTALITGSPDVPCNEAAIIGAGCGGYWAWATRPDCRGRKSARTKRNRAGECPTLSPQHSQCSVE